jgi:iron-sulfur cluster repair protein YtfE (RIC family)
MTATLVRHELPMFLTAFAAMHDAMRRDAARLVAAVPQLGSPHEAGELSAWWHRFAGVIVHHHQREDDIVWPALTGRATDFADDMAVLVDDHHELDRAMARVGETLTSLAAGAAAEADASAAALAFADILIAHLAREEAAAFPRLAACFSAEEYEAIEKEITAGNSLAHVAFEFPWVLDEAAPEVVDHIKAMVPGWGLALNRMVFTPRYHRQTRVLTETSR